MHIVAFAYMAALGLEAASCTIIGFQLMRNDMEKTYKFYRQFQLVTCCIYIFISVIIYLAKDPLAKLFTDDKNVVAIITSIIWLISFNTFPDGFKGMLKGMIKALGLQAKCAWISIFSQWCINMTLMWYFGVHLDLQVKGLWYAKLTMEYIILTCF